ncbi:kinase-like protein [Wolfiporia cocos MD-104 SS10]|uniref:Kinase-like protein n=1 Tax=Wolfiporia cocos (strain MD-104) TaxID=742152 RepID=A0A2H3JJL4_WOLCO|nr:kinase-like protein [Wolfiporia cocos MD-104 SS10]
MKCEDVNDSEPLAISLVRESTTIPVPAVRRYLTVNGNNAIIMDYIPGQTLEDCWGQLGFWRRLRVVWTIRRYIRQLQRVLVPGTPRSKQFPGRIGNGPQLSPSAEDHVHTATLGASAQFLTDVEYFTFDSSLPLVLTHLDLNPRNLMIDHDSCVWFIDREHASFYPQWFEYVAMLNGWEMLGRWRGWILGFMAGFYRRQNSFIAKISWAIETGHFL